MSTTFRTLLTRALTAGLLVGAVVGIYQLVVVEPVIDDAIELEERLAAEADHDDAPLDTGHDHGDGEALFARTEQVGGGVAGTVLYAVVLSVLFGTVLAATRHRLPGATDLGRSAWLAAVGFATVVLIPALEYPPNPPAVGDPETVGQRTFQWAALILGGIVLVRLLCALSGRLRKRLPDHTRAAAVAVTTVVAFGAALVLFPGTPDAVDPAVPADLVWDFRIRSIGGLALLWAGLGIGVGWLVEQDSQRLRSDAAPELVTS